MCTPIQCQAWLHPHLWMYPMSHHHLHPRPRLHTATATMAKRRPRRRHGRPRTAPAARPRRLLPRNTQVPTHPPARQHGPPRLRSVACTRRRYPGPPAWTKTPEQVQPHTRRHRHRHRHRLHHRHRHCHRHRHRHRLVTEQRTNARVPSTRRRRRLFMMRSRQSARRKISRLAVQCACVRACVTVQCAAVLCSDLKSVMLTQL